MNITKKLVSIIIIITLILCSNLNLFNNMSYADEEDANITSGQNTGENTTTGETTQNNTTTSDTNNEESNENTTQSQDTNQSNNTPKATTTTTKTTTTTQKSSNANLSDLGIKPNDFKGFKPSITTYDVEVENSVTSIEIYAKTQDSRAKATGGGKKSLSEGKNSFNIVVTAQNGTKKTYTLNITRKTSTEDKEEEEEKDTSSEEMNFEDNVNDKVFGLSKLSIEGIKLSPEFKTDIYEYTAKYEGEETALNIIATAAQEDSNVEIIGNENLENGDNLINILVTDSEGNIYTYQITLKKNSSANKLFGGQLNKETLLAIGIGAGVVLLLIIIILISRKVRKGKKKINEEPLEELPVIENDIDEEAERIAFVNSILQTNNVQKEEEKTYVQDSWFKKEQSEEDKEEVEKNNYEGPLIYEPEYNYDFEIEEKEKIKNKHKKKRSKGKRFK